MNDEDYENYDDYDEDYSRGRTLKVNVGNVLRCLRESKKLSKKELQNQIGLSIETIDQIEYSPELPKQCSGIQIDLAKRLSKLYDIHISNDFLVYGEISDRDLYRIYNVTGCVPLDEFSILASENKLQDLEKDERFAPYGIKGLGWINEDSKPKEELTGSFVKGSIVSPIKYQYILPLCFFAYVATSKDISKKTIDYLLAPRVGEFPNPWFTGIPHLIHEAYRNNNKKLLDQLLSFAEENNAKAFSNKRTEYSLNDTWGLYLGKYGIITIDWRTIDLAVKREDLEYMERFNKIVQEINNNFSGNYLWYKPVFYDEFYRARIDNDSKLSEIDKYILKCVHYGILNVGELIPETWEMSEPDRSGSTRRVKKIKNDFVAKNFDKLTKAIEKYPVSFVDAVDEILDKSQWDELAKYNDDIFLSSLNRGSGQGSYGAVLDWLESEPVKAHNESEAKKSFDELKSKFSLCSSKFDRKLIPEDNTPVRGYTPQNPYAHIKDANEAKKARLHDICLQYDMFNKQDELSKEYFLKELDKKKYRDLLIDLCVRLETTLDSKYGDEENLMDNLERYCKDNQRAPWDLLSKLVRCRNNEVHRKTSDESLTYDEFMKCIDYVCSM